ncbi:MAG: hypothetical protein ACRYFZ_09710 [Janthinobacterium lividum]
MTNEQISALENCVKIAYANAISLIPSPPHKRALDAIAELRATQNTGAVIILNERIRQVSQEGYSLLHDASAYKNRQLIAASEAYLKADEGFFSALAGELGLAKHLLYKAGKMWPWALNFFKPTENRVRNLAKAGALIAAEIDRIKDDAWPSKAEITPADAKELDTQIHSA